MIRDFINFFKKNILYLLLLLAIFVSNFSVIYQPTIVLHVRRFESFRIHNPSLVIRASFLLFGYYYFFKKV